MQSVQAKHMPLNHIADTCEFDNNTKFKTHRSYSIKCSYRLSGDRNENNKHDCYETHTNTQTNSHNSTKKSARQENTEYD